MKKSLIILLAFMLTSPAFASDTKITALTAMTALTSDDLLLAVDDPLGTPITKKITATNAASSLMAIGAANPTSAIAAGTVYTLTATPAKVAFGTTSPSIVIPSAGTWLLFANAQTNLVGATYAAPNAVTYKIRRTNETAADVADSSRNSFIPIITTVTDSGPAVVLGPIIYTTVNADDALELWGSVTGTPSAGSVTVSAGSIIAIRIK